MSRDVNPSPELTERQLYILSALIRSHIQQPEPVSSKQLAEDDSLGVSSATIRNELVVLEQLGMIRSPHTSAGRIPTEKGYGYFVKFLLDAKDLTLSNQDQIRDALHESMEETMGDVQKWLRTAVSVLATQTQAAALVTEPRSRAARFKHIQLIATHGRLVLMVMVMEGGDVLQQMLTLTEAVNQERLTNVSTMINETFHSETASKILTRIQTVQDVLAREVLELIIDVLSEVEQGRELAIHTFGFGNILPEFEKSAGAQQALQVLEGNQVISRVLAETLNDDADDPLRVIVGGDGRYEEINQLGIVIGRYGTDHLMGALSVLGPTRMRYGRAISTVRYISTLISAMMKDFYGPEE